MKDTGFGLKESGATRAGPRWWPQVVAFQTRHVPGISDARILPACGGKEQVVSK